MAQAACKSLSMILLGDAVEVFPGLVSNLHCVFGQIDAYTSSERSFRHEQATR